MAHVPIDCPGCGAHLSDLACTCVGVGCIHEIAACFDAYLGHQCSQ